MFLSLLLFMQVKPKFTQVERIMVQWCNKDVLITLIANVRHASGKHSSLFARWIVDQDEKDVGIDTKAVCYITVHVRNLLTYARVFVPGKPFKSGLMFAGSAGACPSEAPFRLSTLG